MANVCQMPENTRPNVSNACLRLIDERERKGIFILPSASLMCVRARMHACMRARVREIKTQKIRIGRFSGTLKRFQRRNRDIRYKICIAFE